jgi:hypothetical protein
MHILNEVIVNKLFLNTIPIPFFLFYFARFKFIYVLSGLGFIERESRIFPWIIRDE